MPIRTHYQVLGVQPDAEDLVIKAAYRALVAIIGVVALLLATPIAEEYANTPSDDSGLVFVPMGFTDTAEDGQSAAQRDIHRNTMMFAMYGDVRGMNRDEYLALGITPFVMGCGIGGKGWEFWTAYNRTIIREIHSRGYNFGRWGLIQS